MIHERHENLSLRIESAGNNIGANIYAHFSGTPTAVYPSDVVISFMECQALARVRSSTR